MSKKKKKVLIAIISNRQYYPKNFAMSLIDLVNETRKKYTVQLINVKSVDVNLMRNRACLYALNKGKESTGTRFDYLVQLDDDHIYPSDFINRFIEHDKDCVVGCTSRRTPDFPQTQYKEIRGIGFRDEKNIVNPGPEEGLIKIGATGPVGMCLKVDVLDSLKFPYFEQIMLNENPEYRGGDIEFCRKLKEESVDIYLDSAISFPHSVGESAYVDRGKVGFYP